MGLTLTLMSLIKVGFLEHAYSHPCILAYISTASAVIILQQLIKIMQLHVKSYDFFELITEITCQITTYNPISTLFAIGALAILTLFYIRKGKPNAYQFWSYGPVFVITIGTIVNGIFEFHKLKDEHLKIYTPGEVPMLVNFYN